MSSTKRGRDFIVLAVWSGTHLVSFLRVSPIGKTTSESTVSGSCVSVAHVRVTPQGSVKSLQGGKVESPMFCMDRLFSPLELIKSANGPFKAALLGDLQA